MQPPKKQNKNKKLPLKGKKKKLKLLLLRQNKKKKTKKKLKIKHQQMLLIMMYRPILQNNHQMRDNKQMTQHRPNKTILKNQMRSRIPRLTTALIVKVLLILMQMTIKTVLQRQKKMIPRHLRKARL